MFPSIDTSMPKQQIKMHAMLDSRSDPPTQRHAWSKTCLMLPLFMLHVRYICLHSVKKDLFSDGNMGTVNIPYIDPAIVASHEKASKTSHPVLITVKPWLLVSLF